MLRTAMILAILVTISAQTSAPSISAHISTSAPSVVTPSFAPPTVPPYISTPSIDESGEIVRFSKHMYAALGTKTAAELAAEFQSEYNSLNRDGRLQTILDSLFEMRLQDILISARHAEKMKVVLRLINKSK